MAKSQTTFAKKEKEKKRLQKSIEKKEKMERRKAEAKKGKSLEEMMAYIDEHGNISTTPLDVTKVISIKAEDIPVDGRNGILRQNSAIRKGKITYFNEEKSYGFIQDLKSQQRVFFHISGLLEPAKENDDVVYETEMSPKGEKAINIRKK
jgi:cold shock CspA family protein